MKRLFIFVLLSLNLFGANLVKPGSIIEQKFKKIGATNCAEVMGKTVNFLLESRDTTYSTVWDDNKPNKSTISFSFNSKALLDEFKFARYGSISYTPVGNNCEGQYTYTEIVPSDCKTVLNYMKDKKNLILDNDGNNNDRYSFTVGNNVYFNLITLKNGDNMNCTIIKSEFISSKDIKE